MLSHVMIGSSDIERSRAFYNAVLGVLGAPEPIENVNTTGQTRLFYRHNSSTFCVTQPINGEPASVANGSTIGFACDSPEQLQAFHDTAIAHGATAVEDPPGPRENTMGVLYLCYFLDPDGHKICGLHRPPRDT
ncbi:MAG: VOC family protein [Pseudomonadota bacterium]